MSRIGKKLITLETGVTASIVDDKVVIKGPRGELSADLLPNLEVVIGDDQVEIKRQRDDKQTRAFHGLMRSLVANHVQGVTQGYEKVLKLVGTGYRVQAKGRGVSMTVGLSHPVEFEPPQGIELKVEGNDTIKVSGIDKQAVGQVTADIRKIKPPEVYKGKGIRYEDEVVRTKPGKTATA